MDVDFELFLVLATLLTGIIALLDLLFFAKKRGDKKMGKIFEYGHSFFPILLIVLVLRSFLVEPFRIPSGSLEPTLLPGDFVAANKFTYGLRLPVSHAKVFSLGEPKTGDIVIFRHPLDPSMDLIKRTIGIPGDVVSYKNKVLYINNVEQPQKLIGHGTDEENGEVIPVDIYEEDINGIKHKIYINPAVPASDFSVTVPPGNYFMMGDNRDDSDDSRYWGFMPEENIIGKAFIIWLSWDGENNHIRFDRMGKIING